MDTEKSIDASEISNAERSSETITGVSSDSLEEKIRATLDHLKAHILTLTQFLNRLIQDNLAQTTPSPVPRTHFPQAECPLSRDV